MNPTIILRKNKDIKVPFSFVYLTPWMQPKKSRRQGMMLVWGKCKTLRKFTKNHVLSVYLINSVLQVIANKHTHTKGIVLIFNTLIKVRRTSQFKIIPKLTLIALPGFCVGLLCPVLKGTMTVGYVDHQPVCWQNLSFTPPPQRPVHLS